MEVKIKLIKNLNLKNPTLIQGFAGAGLVGTISALYLVEKLKMDFVGYVHSDKFPPIAAIHKGKPYFPARLYASKKHNLIILFSEFIIPTQFVYPLAFEIYNFAKKYKIKKIISLGSIVKKDEIDYKSVYAVASTAALINELEKQNIHVIKEGVTTGISSVLLSLGAIENFQVISLLPLSSDSAVDLMACLNLLFTLKNYLNIDLDLQDLEKDAAKMKEEMEKLAQKPKTATELTAIKENLDQSSMYQ
jgi:uncharacterized protein